MIPQRNISLLSNRLAAGGGLRIREDVLERDYCLAWFLNAMAESDLRPVLAFKVHIEFWRSTRLREWKGRGRTPENATSSATVFRLAGRCDRNTSNVGQDAGVSPPFCVGSPPSVRP